MVLSLYSLQDNAVGHKKRGKGPFGHRVTDTRVTIRVTPVTVIPSLIRPPRDPFHNDAGPTIMAVRQSTEFGMTWSMKARVTQPADVLVRELDGESVILNLDNEAYFGLDAVGT